MVGPSAVTSSSTATALGELEEEEEEEVIDSMTEWLESIDTSSSGNDLAASFSEVKTEAKTKAWGSSSHHHHFSL